MKARIKLLAYTPIWFFTTVLRLNFFSGVTRNFESNSSSLSLSQSACGFILFILNHDWLLWATLWAMPRNENNTTSLAKHFNWPQLGTKGEGVGLTALSKWSCKCCLSHKRGPQWGGRRQGLHRMWEQWIFLPLLTQEESYSQPR